MRLIPSLTTALVLLSIAPASAQEWTDFVSRDDGFKVNFPAAPTVTRATYTSEYGATLPARVYRVARDQERYSVTVVDYRPIEKLLTEKGEDSVRRSPTNAAPASARVPPSGPATGRPTSAARWSGRRGSSCSATRR